ncbi:PadR family transcriptional regulator [Phytohabitans houttuyneae]|uniref:PadR family transcriptional regulator n=1 Tax=Phytohabitans houttuyneae TaxID=1076126 RepID=A0A6V8K939_9ACTN|nr:PadR family transcriptional regulator [Phytohabitans houttuyneae]GFJ81732.1 PadR family transcriptional regulator [Phytohabitans houttuyneae]
MTVSYTLLGLLNEADRHGYDLKQSYDRRFGAARPLRFGQVYRTLAQLERDGLIEVIGVEQGAGPDRKRYTITADGVTDLSRWLAEPEDPQPQLQTVLFTKVALALLSGKPAEEFLERQRDRHLAVMRELTAARRKVGLRDSMLIDYQLFHIEADLRWIDHAAGRLDTLAAELAP